MYHCASYISTVLDSLLITFHKGNSIRLSCVRSHFLTHSSSTATAEYQHLQADMQHMYHIYQADMQHMYHLYQADMQHMYHLYQADMQHMYHIYQADMQKYTIVLVYHIHKN